jgi:hypothetical protein
MAIAARDKPVNKRKKRPLPLKGNVAARKKVKRSRKRN